MFSITDRPLSGTKSAGWRGDDLDAVLAAALERVAEALRAVLGHRDAGDALDLDDVALALQLVGEVVAGLPADAVVVAGDERAVGAGRR